jgi:hypothetical protein
MNEIGGVVLGLIVSRKVPTVVFAGRVGSSSRMRFSNFSRAAEDSWAIALRIVMS